MQLLSRTLCALSLSVGPVACVCGVLGHCVSRPLPLRVWGAAAVVLPPVVSGSVPQDYLEQKHLLPSRLMQLLLPRLSLSWCGAPLSFLRVTSTTLSSLFVHLFFSLLSLSLPLSLFLSLSLHVCVLGSHQLTLLADDCMALYPEAQFWPFIQRLSSCPLCLFSLSQLSAVASGAAAEFHVVGKFIGGR